MRLELRGDTLVIFAKRPPMLEKVNSDWILRKGNKVIRIPRFVSFLRLPSRGKCNKCGSPVDEVLKYDSQRDIWEHVKSIHRWKIGCKY